MLFEGGFIAWDPNTPRTYDVSPDGRFLMIEPTPNYLAQRFAVVLNWTEELKPTAHAEACALHVVIVRGVCVAHSRPRTLKRALYRDVIRVRM